VSSASRSSAGVVNYMERVLIVLLGALGDVVRGFSILPPLKQAFPRVHITWLVEPKCKGIVSLHPLVDEVLVFQRPNAPGKAGPLSLLKDTALAVSALRSDLKTRNFEVTLDLQRHFKSGFFSLLSKSPRRIGFHRKNAKEFNWIFNTETIEPCSNEVSKVHHYLSFLKQIEIPLPTQINFGLHEAIKVEDISPVLRERSSPLVGLVLGSTWSSKDWPFEGYERLVSLLAKDGCIPVLLGDKTQGDLARRILDSYRGNPETIINLAGQTTLRELLGAMSVLDLCAGPDSGPGHIAAALQKPYISLFGPTSPERVAPFGQEHLTMRSGIGCSPCWRRVCPGLDTLCMRLLSAEAVMQQVRHVLNTA
jgi:lipopolysaccharide heptosyltransferase II